MDSYKSTKNEEIDRDSSKREDKSFSMAFNPITNIKSVREYEQHVATLNEEIFDLKTQLANLAQNTTANNIPKILYENSNRTEELHKQINALKIENVQLKGQIEDCENNIAIVISQNEEKDHKILLLEDENKRLLGRLNKTQTNESQLRNIVIGLENEIKHSSIQNETSNNDNSYLRNELNNVKNENELLKQRNYELDEQNGRLKNECEILNEKQRNMINSFSSNNENLKDQLLEYTTRENGYKKEIEELNTNKHQYMANLINFKNGMNKFRKIVMGKLEEVTNKMVKTESEVELLYKKYKISRENREIIENLNMKSDKLDEVITQLIKNGNKAKTVDKVSQQIKEALEELNIIREYMQRKAKECKELKVANAKLMNEQVKTKKQLENAKKFYEGVTEKYGPNCIRI